VREMNDTEWIAFLPRGDTNGLTFLSKTTENVDYAVMSLEELWWSAP